MVESLRRDWKRIVASVALLLVAASLALNYRYSAQWGGSYLLASNARGIQDRELRLLAASVSTLTYVRADSGIAVGIAKKAVESSRIYDGNGKVRAEGLSQIEATVGRIKSAEDLPRLRVYAFALILGSLLGTVFAKGLARRPEFLLISAACVSVAKARMVCSTCLPSAELRGFDAAWVGAGAYALAALGCLVRPGQTRKLALIVAGGGIVWQALQLFSDIPDCAMCQSVLALNATLLASLAVAEGVTIPAPIRWRRFAWLGCVAIPALVISRPTADRAHETAVRSKLDYTGKSLDVLLPKVRVPKEGLLVMFGKPTCEPCVEAHTALGRSSPLPFSTGGGRG